MAHDRCNYFSFCTIFCPFTPLTTQKMEISKKMKKNCLEISFYTSAPKNHDHMLHCSWDMVCDRCNCYFSFWATFCPFTPNSPKNQNFTNMKKTPGDIILHMCTKKMMMYVDNDDVWLDDAWFLRYGAQRMDGRTKKKWHIEMGVPPKNYTRKNYTVLRNS